jgi:hypothetical protein
MCLGRYELVPVRELEQRDAFLCRASRDREEVATVRLREATVAFGESRRRAGEQLSRRPLVEQWSRGPCGPEVGTRCAGSPVLLLHCSPALLFNEKGRGKAAALLVE